MDRNAFSAIYEFQRDQSVFTDPAELVRSFVDALTRVMPISRLLYVMPWPPPVRRFAWLPDMSVPAGALGFRVLLDVRGGAAWEGSEDAYRRMFEPRTGADADGSGGLLGRITGQTEALLESSLVLGPEEPMLGGPGARHRSMMAVPIFWQSHIQAWIVAFADEPNAFELDDLRLLLNSGNMLARSAVTLDTLEEARRANARVRQTLDEIGRVQRSLLPSVVPGESSVQIATSYLPSEESGGDYYDIAEVEEGVLELVIADVAGHGPVAAVCAAMLRTAVLAHRQFGDRTSRVRAVNRLMRLSLEDGMFITALFVTIDRGSGRVRFVNCGHHPPIVRSVSGEVRVIEAEGGPPLGVLDELDPDAASFFLEPGDTLVLYTDGLIESFSPAGKLFGMRRLRDAIERADGSPRGVVAAVQAALESHASGRPRMDDETLVVLRFLGGAAEGGGPRAESNLALQMREPGWAAGAE